ncbi:sulfite oxidase heme-binding subunit YedZ [Alteromonas sp. A079]|uniref:sulfite oxidase heme-binding subunit YedZ n=1 Tax=Alteromonas sp. A079 TaxID=3410268 RepID=UPI003BA1D3A9
MRLLNQPVRFSSLTRLVLKALIHFSAIGYLVFLFYSGVTDNLGPDPVDTLLNETGIWAIHLLFITLLLSPLAKHLPSPEPMHFRRMIGVYVFVYACSHLATYVLFELQLDMALIASEIISRPYIIVGMLAFVLLFLLTATSFMRVRRRMGKRWQQLHNSIYVITGLTLLHFSWSQKTFWQEPVFYWLFAVLLLQGRIRGIVLQAYTRWQRRRVKT